MWRELNRGAMVDPKTVRSILDRVGGRWEPAILGALEAGRLRASPLRLAVSRGLDWRTLTDTTNRLQARGLVTRTTGRVRRRTAVWYELTDAGRVVLQLLADVESWGADHPEEVARLLLAPDDHPDGAGDEAAPGPLPG
jgi:DNA-binding HxlR family transcriptional regulator